MQTASDVGYSHDNEVGCPNTLCHGRPFGMQVSENADVAARVHMGRDGQRVTLNQDGELVLQFDWQTDGWKRSLRQWRFPRFMENIAAVRFKS